MALIQATAIPTADTGYSIDYSCRFNKADVGHLKRTMSTPTSTQKFTFSFWFKGSTAWANVQQNFMGIGSSGSDYAEISVVTGGYIQMFEYHGGYDLYYRNTGYLLNDPSAWMHVVFAIDTTQSTAADRMRIYYNGVEDTVADNTTPTEDYALYWFNSAVEWTIGAQFNETGNAFDGYLAEMHYVDGAQLAPTEFGEFGDYAEWKPIEASGLTYGNNGFYLDFADSSALGNDVSGNNNDWTVGNLIASDQVLDTPTNNFPTLNYLSKMVRTQYPVEGALKVICGGTETSSPHGIAATMAAPGSGKWYWEVAVGDGLYSKYARIGCADPDNHKLVRDIMRGINSASLPWIYEGGAWGYDCNNGHKQSGGSAVSYGSGATDGSTIIGIALDVDNGKIWFSDNGTWIASGNPVTGANPAFDNVTSGHVLPYVNTQDGAAGFVTLNFGQDSSFAGLKTAQGNSDGGGVGDFYYTPPTNFLALCTKNFPDVAVVPSENFTAEIWTGDGEQTRNITTGFQPDFAWVKNVNSGNDHVLNDVLRGFAALNTMRTSGTESEATQGANAATYGWTDDVGSTYATLNKGTGDGTYVNRDTYTYVGWFWKAGGSGSANTAGDMAETVTVSANTDAGFSIVTYTGDGSAGTVGHGLSKAPEMVIVKSRSATGHWFVYHSGNTSAPETDRMILSTTNATDDDAAYWNDTAPTSSVFTVGTYAGINTDDDTMVAYCFHSVDGYSKVGTHSGNGLAEGPFVYTGFRPAWLMVKHTSQLEAWTIWDTARDTHNQSDLRLFANTSTAETENALAIDILSNGFKLRHPDASFNTNDNEYIYLAFAETPFKYSNAR